MIFNKKYFKLCNTIVVIMTKRVINRYSKEIFRASSNLQRQYENVSSSHRNFLKKETLPKVFCCEFCEISKNTFFT